MDKYDNIIRGNKKRTLNANKEFEEWLHNNYGDKFTFLGRDHTNRHTLLTIKCNDCGSIISKRIDEFKRLKRMCPVCMKPSTGGQYSKLTTDEFKEVLYNKYGNLYTVESEYTGTKNKILIKHTTCGQIFKTTPWNMVRGRGCNKCNTMSKGEVLISNILESNNIDFKLHAFFDGLEDINKLSYDFYIPKLDILIEYQGIQHYKPNELFGVDYFDTQKCHDEIKRKFANDNGMTLIEISYKYNTRDKIVNKINSSVIQGVLTLK